MILREHRRKPQGLADLLNWAALVGDGVVVNKDGSFLAGWSYTGPDLDAATAEELALLSQHFNQALLPLGDEWLLNADAIRRPSRDYPPPGPFPDPVSELLDEERREQYESGRRNFETTCTLCVSWLPPDELQSSLARWFISGEERRGPDWRAQVETFVDRLEEIEDRLSASLTLARLGSEALLTHLHTCLTGLYHRVAVPETPCYLDVLLASQDLYGGFSPRVGDRHLRAVSITGFPHESHPAMFDFLHRIPMEYRLSHRFLPLDPETAAKQIRLYRRNWWQKRKGLGGLIKEAITTEEQAAEPKFVNRDAVRMAEDADEALAECLGGAVRYGFYTTTVVLMNEDEAAVEVAARQVLKEIHNRGFTARIERVNALEAFRSSLPSHAHPNVRRPLISTINLADLLPTTSVWPGLPTNPCGYYPPGSPALLWAATSGSTPFRLNLHVSDVGHTLVLGPTGAGKSTLLGLIQAQFFRYPEAQVFTFDKGYSSFPLVAACGGHHYDIAAEALDALAFYPLAEIDRPAERTWAAEWIETLMALQGVAVTPAHRGAIDHALGLLAASPSRTLTDLQVKLQDPNLRQALRPYTLKGNFGALLDARSDDLREGRFQVFEMANLMELGDRIVIPALLYLFHRIEQRLDGRPTLIILEEAWTYLLHELFAERIQLWLKELRKYNAAVVFVTQSLADIHGSSKRHVIYESCPTKILLPNSEAGTEQGAAIYRAIGLNEREIEIIAQSVRKRDYYYTSPLGNRLMDLTLGPLALAFVGATGREDLRAIRELRATYGPEWPRAWMRQRGLDRWADRLAARKSDPNERSLACAG